MYNDFYKLSGKPFQLSPNPRFFFGSSGHQKAIAYLQYGLHQGEGFIVITGEVGAGKTTLIGHLLAQLDPAKYLAAKLVTTQIEADDTLRMVASAFGIEARGVDKATLLRNLERFALDNQRRGRRVLVVVDEVQNLPIKSLEELRMLSNFQVNDVAAVQFCLLGQPQFRDILASEDLAQLRQRVVATYHLGPLSPEETRAYIEHRLEVAGAGNREIFTPDSYHEIYRYTAGVPRLINTLCDTAMMAAFTDNRDHVRRADVLSAVAELRWQPRKAGHADANAAPAAAASAGDTPLSAEARQAAAAGPHVPAREAAPGEAAHTATPATGAAAASAPSAAAPRQSGLQVGKLLVATDGRTVQEVPLRIGRLIVGRTPDNDVHIDSRFVSRHHCQIITTEHSCVVEDLNSTNGIYVKSARVRRHYLNDGDVVLVGKHELMYVDERASHSHSVVSDTLPKIPALAEIPELHAAPAAEGTEDSKGKRSAEG